MNWSWSRRHLLWYMQAERWINVPNSFKILSRVLCNDPWFQVACTLRNIKLGIFLSSKNNVTQNTMKRQERRYAVSPCKKMYSLICLINNKNKRFILKGGHLKKGDDYSKNPIILILKLVFMWLTWHRFFFHLWNILRVQYINWVLSSCEQSKKEVSNLSWIKNPHTECF